MNMKEMEIETPALIVDLDEVDYNMAVMSSLLKGSKAQLRPHFKTTKSLYFVRKQLEAGAKGITCAKLGEAEVLVEAGVPDILIANQVVQPSKIDRLAFLARKTHLTVCVDQAKNILDLEKAAEAADSCIHIYIEFEVGMKRCGVEEFEDFYRLAKLVTECEHLSFDGIQAYAGQLSHEEDEVKRIQGVKENEQRLLELKKYVEERQIPVKEISGCSTGTVVIKAKDNVYTELQCGSYIFDDATYIDCKVPFHSALSILTTVISRKSGRMIADVGVKGMGMDQKPPKVKEYPDSNLVFSEEHLGLVGEEYSEQIGDKLHVIPGHCCTTINMYDYLYLKRGEEILGRIPIEGRGKSL